MPSWLTCMMVSEILIARATSRLSAPALGMPKSKYPFDPILKPPRCKVSQDHPPPQHHHHLAPQPNWEGLCNRNAAAPEHFPGSGAPCPVASRRGEIQSGLIHLRSQARHVSALSIRGFRSRPVESCGEDETTSLTSRTSHQSQPRLSSLVGRRGVQVKENRAYTSESSSGPPPRGLTFNEGLMSLLVFLT